MDKTREIESREGGEDGWGGGGVEGSKCRQLCLNNNKIIFLKNESFNQENAKEDAILYLLDLEKLSLKN